MQWEDRIGRRIKFRDLHIALAVAHSGSMLKAAEALAISQPVVSKVIADLEQALGVRLFDRSRKGVEPTASGRALLNRGRAAFDELKQGVKEIEFLNDPTAGELRIGCNALLAASFVSAVVDRLSRRYPRIEFHHMTAFEEELHRELTERNVDLLVTRKFRPTDERLGFEFLYDDSYAVAASAQSLWARRRRVELAELVSEPWILPPPETVTGSVAVEAFRASGLDYPRVTLVTNSPEVRMSFLATGRYLTIFADLILRFPTKRPEIKVLPIELPMARVPIGIVTLKNRTLSPAAQLFINSAREVAKPLAKRKR